MELIKISNFQFTLEIILLFWKAILFFLKIAFSTVWNILLSLIVITRQCYEYLMLYRSSIRKYKKADEEFTRASKYLLSLINYFYFLSIFNMEAPRRTHSRQHYTYDITEILNKWYSEHEDNPYATPKQKHDLANKTSLSTTQITRWLINARAARRSVKAEVD
jgi:Homeobox KN domain